MDRGKHEQSCGVAATSSPRSSSISTSLGTSNAASLRFFEHAEDITIDSIGTFRIYSSIQRSEGSPPPVVICLHGANYSGLSFSLLARELRDVASVIAFDARGHGATQVPGESDASAARLAADCHAIIQHFIETRYSSPAACPPIVLLGHSMGAAIAAHVAAGWAGAAHRSPLGGLVMIDLVEETAVASLPHMMDVVNSMPQTFPSKEAAVQWAVGCGMPRLRASAEISVPSYLIPVRLDAAASHASGSNSPDHNRHSTPAASSAAAPSPSSAVQPPPSRYTWRAGPFMRSSQPHWRGWFTGTSAMFLSCPAPRLLILAGLDRLQLDADLTIGQMQGKFQLAVIPGAGHVVHEDAPDKVGLVVKSFLSRAGLTQDTESRLLQAKLERARAQAREARVVSSTAADGSGGEGLSK